MKSTQDCEDPCDPCSETNKADKSTAQADKSTIKADKSTVKADKSTVKADKSTDTADKATSATGKANKATNTAPLRPPAAAATGAAGDKPRAQSKYPFISMDKKPLMSNLRNGANNLTVFLTKGPAVRQLAVGALSGWTTGFMAIRVGKPIALTVGGSIIVFQLAQQQGLIKTDWQDVKHKLKNTAEGISPNMNGPRMLTKAQTFAKGNRVFAAGFIGGFLIGLAS